jgi:type VI secretion system protein ImpL
VPNGPGVREVRLLDFGDMFGNGGIFQRFFATHVEKFVDTTRRPWTWKPGAPAGVPLRLFEQAQRIREMFFEQGRAPQVVFGVTFESLEGGADRVQFDVDGNMPVPTYRHDGARQWKVVWPGPKPGTATVTFEERGKAAQHLIGEGDWALFKLMAQGVVSAADADHFRLTIGKDKYKVVIGIDAMRVNNVFAGLTTLHGFRCGG